MVQKEPKNCSDNLCCALKKPPGLHLNKKNTEGEERSEGPVNGKGTVIINCLNKSRTFSHFTGSSLYISTQENSISPRGSCHTMSQIVLLRSNTKKGTGSLPHSDADGHKREDRGGPPKPHPPCTQGPIQPLTSDSPPPLYISSLLYTRLLVFHFRCTILGCCEAGFCFIVKCDRLLKRSVYVISPKLISPHIRRINSFYFFSLSKIYIYIYLCVYKHPPTYIYIFVFALILSTLEVSHFPVT
ncbi:UNVERIFIED_CONTAM: hypothetical protein K2H54_027686 [Gekko kuhli]